VVSGIGRLDTAGAWLLYRASRALGTPQAPAPIEGASEDRRALIEEVGKSAPRPTTPPPARNPLLSALARLGEALLSLARAAIEMLGF
jgi:phospholipid/cholesterol/gamma-HCH transport system permease protein